MRKLTKPQLEVLHNMPRARDSRFWRGPFGLSISARSACEAKGLIRETLRGSIWTFDLTDAGRAALAEQEKGDTPRPAPNSGGEDA